MRRRARRKLILGMLVVAALFAAASYFLLFFYVPDDQAEVQGNVRYTDAEIRRMAMPGFKEHNSLYLRFLRKEISLPEIPFIDSIEVEYLGRDRVRLHANEEYPVGYLLQGGNRYYFNAAGIVTEILDDAAQRQEEEKAEQSLAVEEEHTELYQQEAEESSKDIQQVSEETMEEILPGDAVSAPAASADSAEQIRPSEFDTSFRPALTGAFLVTGLTDAVPGVGEQIVPEDTGIFRTLLAVDKLLNKLNVHPDEIRIDPDGTMSLRCGEVLIDIGKERLLDEKMTRAAAILPQLDGMKGTLHLENYNSGTVNIIFSAD